MSDSTAAVKVEGATTVPAESEQGRDAEKLGDAGVRALQAERDARAAAEARAKAAEAERDDLRRRGETQVERIQRERDEAIAAASVKDALNSRYEAAEAAGLPLSWAKRLVGATPDELRSDAVAMATELGEKSKPGAPRPDPSQGSAGGQVPAGSVSAGRDLWKDMHNKPTS